MRHVADRSRVAAGLVTGPGSVKLLVDLSRVRARQLLATRRSISVSDCRSGWPTWRSSSTTCSTSATARPSSPWHGGSSPRYSKSPPPRPGHLPPVGSAAPARSTLLLQCTSVWSWQLDNSIALIGCRVKTLREHVAVWLRVKDRPARPFPAFRTGGGRAALIGLALTDAHGVYMATAECHGCPICQLMSLCG